MNQNNYLEFHHLKTEIASKLKTMADGSRMDTLSDDFVEEITVGDRVDEIVEMVVELKRLKNILVSSEES